VIKFLLISLISFPVCLYDLLSGFYREREVGELIDVCVIEKSLYIKSHVHSA
jgi:hypothetical protein